MRRFMVIRGHPRYLTLLDLNNYVTYYSRLSTTTPTVLDSLVGRVVEAEVVISEDDPLLITKITAGNIGKAVTVIEDFDRVFESTVEMLRELELKPVEEIMGRFSEEP